MTTTEQVQPYAECLDCDAQFTDRATMTAHQMANMAPTGEQGVVARGHSARVVNPTPEETEARRVRYEVTKHIERAIERAIEDIEDSVSRGNVTLTQVADVLRDYPDFEDAWAEATA